MVKLDNSEAKFIWGTFISLGGLAQAAKAEAYQKINENPDDYVKCSNYLSNIKAVINTIERQLENEF